MNKLSEILFEFREELNTFFEEYRIPLAVMTPEGHDNSRLEVIPDLDLMREEKETSSSCALGRGEGREEGR